MEQEALWDDVLANIFCRLTDCEDVIRFTAVCKQWRRIIHQCLPRIWQNIPLSGLLCRTMKLSSPLIRPGIIPYIRDLRCFNHLTDAMRYASLDGVDDRLRSPTLQGSELKLMPEIQAMDSINSCNGLLLFQGRVVLRFYVWNPTTKQCLLIPSMPDKAEEAHRTYEYAALAFDLSESLHFRIVQFTMSDRPQSEPLRLDIFHSNSQEWVRRAVRRRYSTTVDNDWCRIGLLKHSVYFNGALYRLSSAHKLVRIDLNNFNLHSIELPKIEEGAAAAVVNLTGCVGVSKSCLHYANVSKEDIFHVWILEESYWSLKYAISTTNLEECLSNALGHRSLEWYEPTAFHPKTDAVFIVTPKAIVSYDLLNGETGVVEDMEGESVVAIPQYFPAFTFNPCPIVFDDLTGDKDRYISIFLK